jgi:hypothetical protein
VVKGTGLRQGLWIFGSVVCSEMQSFMILEKKKRFNFVEFK